MQRPTLRFGPHHVQYATHFDWHPNFLTQVSGEKHVVLMGPLEGDYLSWQQNPSHPHHRQSYVWPREPRAEQQDFSNAMGLQTFLQPGDVLYIPPVWFHYLETSPPASLEAGDDMPFWLSLNAMANYTVRRSANGGEEDVYICGTKASADDHDL